MMNKVQVVESQFHSSRSRNNRLEDELREISHLLRTVESSLSSGVKHKHDIDGQLYRCRRRADKIREQIETNNLHTQKTVAGIQEVDKMMAYRSSGGAVGMLTPGSVLAKTNTGIECVEMSAVNKLADKVWESTKAAIPGGIIGFMKTIEKSSKGVSVRLHNGYAIISGDGKFLKGQDVLGRRYKLSNAFATHPELGRVLDIDQLEEAYRRHLIGDGLAASEQLTDGLNTHQGLANALEHADDFGTSVARGTGFTNRAFTMMHANGRAAVVNEFDDMFKVMGKNTGGLRRLGGVVNGLTMAFTVGKGIKEDYDKGTDALDMGIGATVDVVYEAGKMAACAYTGAAAGAAIGSIVPVAGTAVGAVAGFAVGVVTSVAYDLVLNNELFSIKDTLEIGVEFLGDVVVGAAHASAELIEAVGEIALVAADAMVDVANTALEAVADVTSTVVDAVVDIGETAVGAAVDVAETAVNALGDAANIATGAITGAAEAVSEALDKWNPFKHAWGWG